VRKPRRAIRNQLTTADADEVGTASASQPMAIPEDKVMGIYPQLPKRHTGWHRSEAHGDACVQPRLEAAMRSVTPVWRSRSGARTLGLTASCRLVVKGALGKSTQLLTRRLP
jgi:ubiquitin